MDQGNHLHEMAALYAAGALSDTEREQFEAHLKAGCQTCEAEVRALELVTDNLALVAAAEPPAGLRQRLLDKVRESKHRPGVVYQRDGLLIARAGEMEWRRVFPGVSVKRINRDAQTRYQTVLMRIDPGASYPEHRHHGAEELYLLSGDLHVAGEWMRAGDYCHAEANTVHLAARSEGGCVMLVRASMDDEVVAG